MNQLVLKSLISEAVYEGRFTTPRFALLGNPIPVYDRLLKQLGNEGATLDSLKFDAASIGTANISCTLANQNVTVRFRIDRLEIAFLRLNQLTRARAASILQKSWAVLHEVDDQVRFSEQTVALTVYGTIEGAKYDDLLRRYVTGAVFELGEGTTGGVLLYVPADSSRKWKPGSILLDRIVGSEEAFVLKVTAGFAGDGISVDQLPQQLNDYVSYHLDRLGLVLSEEESK
jgi:hypothetical protein